MATVHENRDSERLDEHVAPPFLRRVRIRGYKSMASCDVTLEPLTILVGRNASGKSNFLDALGFFRDVMQLGANEAGKRYGGADTLLCHLKSDRIIKFELECATSSVEDDTPLEAVFTLEIEFPKKQ